MISKKKAFTLTELLIVVIVIGVLSAVVLPKFNKVVETRKTTEAEEVMAAIRTEQEQRCSLNKQYSNDFTSFLQSSGADLTASTVNTAKASSRNYEYMLSGQTIRAKSKDAAHTYTLKMPSIEDGRICCSGAYCNQLNKNYPLCNNFTYASSTAECIPEAVCDEDELTDEVQYCECNGTRPHACGANGEWGWGDECVGATTADVRYNQHYTPAGKGPAGCATRTETQTCSNHAWTWDVVNYSDQNESACQTLECTPGQNGGTVGCGQCGQKTKTCDSNGFWSYGSCVGSSSTTQSGGSCTTSEGYAGTYLTPCASNGNWSTTSTCTCNEGATRTVTEACGNGYSGNKTRTCTCNSTGGESCGAWNTSGCSVSCSGSSSQYQDCDCDSTHIGGSKYCTRTCNNGSWSGWSCGSCTGCYYHNPNPGGGNVTCYFSTSTSTVSSCTSSGSSFNCDSSHAGQSYTTCNCVHYSAAPIDGLSHDNYLIRPVNADPRDYPDDQCTKTVATCRCN